MAKQTSQRVCHTNHESQSHRSRFLIRIRRTIDSIQSQHRHHQRRQRSGTPLTVPPATPTKRVKRTTTTCRRRRHHKVGWLLQYTSVKCYAVGSRVGRTLASPQRVAPDPRTRMVSGNQRTRQEYRGLSYLHIPRILLWPSRSLRRLLLLCTWRAIICSR